MIIEKTLNLNKNILQLIVFYIIFYFSSSRVESEVESQSTRELIDTNLTEITQKVVKNTIRPLFYFTVLIIIELF